jgi:hypothetical protein
MKTEMRKGYDQQRSKANALVPPEMHAQIRRLKAKFDQYDGVIADYFQLLSDINAGLDIARQTARCLLTGDPFAAWEMVAKQWERQECDKDYRAAAVAKPDAGSTPGLKGNVERLITPQLIRQTVEAKAKLDECGRILGAFFDDMNNLDSLDAALEHSAELQSREPLVKAETSKDGD